MKKVYLLEVRQQTNIRYVGSIDARELVKLATKVELQATQEAQRPINPKRLEEIATFVAADGTLSTSVVIGTRDDRLQVKSAEDKKCPSLYYMEYPETSEEYKKYENSFDIMDGQHRLFSFLDEYCKLGDDSHFEITFELYLKPSLRTRRLIFKNTNEKQEKVASNLLLWFREQLNMLSDKEQKYHGVVSLLNSETKSPLRGRIIMGAEKITGGFKAQQVITILDKYDIINIQKTNTPLDDEKMLTLISTYLTAWENAVGSKIVDRAKEYGAFSKIAGFRFMMIMLPVFFECAIDDKAQFNEKYVTSKIKELFANDGMEPKDLFYAGGDYIKSLGSNPFAGETPITILAKEWSGKLKSLSSGSFDPLA